MGDSENDPVVVKMRIKEEKKVQKEKLSAVVSPSPRILTEKIDNSNETTKKTSDGGVKASPSEKVKVIVRCRPLSKKEMDNGHTSVVDICRVKNEIEIRRPNPSSANLVHAKHNKVFTFDTVYDNEISQKELYEDAFRSLVDSVLEGFNGTIFAYGQTGTGKTYTMEGIRDKEEHHGVIPHAFKHIFQKISDSPNKKYLVRASYLEIYQEDIRDLLFKDRVKNCDLKESGGGVYVKDLSSYLCANFNQINDLMTRGNKNRSVGATNMNEHSSRSHAIFMITVEASEKWADGRTHFRVGKLNLVDLAGSERQGKSGAEGERLKEAVKINLSLSALGNVIASLADGRSSHIPYRDSKLTRLLQDSLGGNSRTIMVATIGPASFNYDETMTTLRYASRAKRIKNKPKVNEDPKDAMLREYQEEIAKLRAELAARKEQNPSLFCELPSQDSARPKSRKSRPTTAIPIEGLKLLDDKHFQELLPLLESYGLGHTRDPKEIMELLENRKRELLRDNLTVKEEKDRLLKKLEETQDRVKGAKEDCFKLYDRIDWLESKVLNGGKSLLDHTNEQQKLVEQRKRELEEQKEREEDILRKIAEHELSTNEIKEFISSQEEEAAYKRNKLGRLSGKLEKVRDRFGSVQFEYSDKRTELELCQLAIQKELKLKKLITDNFIPPKTRETVESLTRFNAEEDSYSSLELNSINIPRPPVNRMIYTALYSSSRDGPLFAMTDLYYTDSNVLQLRPEMPSPITHAKPEMAYDPQITALLNRAFNEVEKEVVVDCTRYNQQRIRRSTAKARLGEILSLEPGQIVRPILSSKQPPSTQGIKYRDFVVVSRVPTRAKSAKLQQRAPSVMMQSEPNYNCIGHDDAHHALPSMPKFTLPNHRFLPALPPHPSTASVSANPDHSSNYFKRHPPGSARFIRSPPSDVQLSLPLSARSTSYVATPNSSSSPRSTYTSFRQLNPAIGIGGGFTVTHPMAAKSNSRPPDSMGDLNFNYEYSRPHTTRTENHEMAFALPRRPSSSRMASTDLLNIGRAGLEPPSPRKTELHDRMTIADLPESFHYKGKGEFLNGLSRPTTAPNNNYEGYDRHSKNSSTPGLSQLTFLAGLFNTDTESVRPKTSGKYSPSTQY